MPRRIAPAATSLVVTAALLLTGCTTSSSPDVSSSGATARAATSSGVFDASTTHTIAVEIDDDDFAAMIATYLDSGDKDWITGRVTIDGQTFTDVGLKLKGNSTLRSVSADSTPESLPWRMRLDKYVDGQAIDGYSDFVVRANTSETSMNEAVALDLLRAAGLATEQAIATRFSVNGSAEQLTLVLQNLDDTWQEESFDDDGILYKADAEGDYSYRGADADAYTSAFSVEAGDEDYEPLIEFLDFVNSSSDAEFAADLDEHLDVAAFATYLALEDLIDNFDDIDGPGNNSFLEYDASTGTFTVVAWDHNLAFGTQNVGGGMGGGGGDRPQRPQGDDDATAGGAPGGAVPGGGAPDGAAPDDAAPGAAPEGRQGGGPGGQSGNNELVTRFMASSTFKAMYDDAVTELRAQLFAGGELDDSVDAWSAVLTDGASDLVDAATVTQEADAIRAYADADSATAAPTDVATSAG